MFLPPDSREQPATTVIPPPGEKGAAVESGKAGRLAEGAVEEGVQDLGVIDAELDTEVLKRYEFPVAHASVRLVPQEGIDIFAVDHEGEVTAVELSVVGTDLGVFPFELIIGGESGIHAGQATADFESQGDAPQIRVCAPQSQVSGSLAGAIRAIGHVRVRELCAAKAGEFEVEQKADLTHRLAFPVANGRAKSESALVEILLTEHRAGQTQVTFRLDTQNAVTNERFVFAVFDDWQLMRVDGVVTVLPVSEAKLEVIEFKGGESSKTYWFDAAEPNRQLRVEGPVTSKVVREAKGFSVKVVANAKAAGEQFWIHLTNGGQRLCATGLVRVLRGPADEEADESLE